MRGTKGRGSNAGHETRARILEVAMELFLAQGYPATSMQQIAGRLGISKAALYYHFASKSDIVGSLVEPMADDLEHALAKAQRAWSRRGVRAGVLEGYLDVTLSYRRSLSVLVRDVSAGPQEFYERLIRLTARAVELITGPEADLRGRIRAAQAISALTDPVMMLPDDVPGEELRGHILEGAWRLLDEPADRQPPQ